MNYEDSRSEKILDYFLGNKDQLLKLQVDELDDLLQLCIITLNESNSNSLKSKGLTVLYQGAFLGSVNLREQWHIYWIINRSLFINSDIQILKGNLETLYKFIFENIKKQTVLPEEYIPISRRNQDKVIVITSQLLHCGHAPTIRVLDYSYTLQRYFDKKVIIINDSGMNFGRSERLEPSIRFAFNDQYNGKDYLVYKDQKFDFYQVDVEMLDIVVIQRLVDIIYEENPMLILNIGGSSLVCDLCTSFTSTACQPCSTAIPTSMSKYILVAHKINQEDEERLRRLEAYQEIIETKLNYIIKSSNYRYTREQFNIPEECFLISVIGNRLDSEMDNEFLKIIDKILHTPGICVVFIGQIEDKGRVEEWMDNFSKAYFTGGQPDASEITKLSNLYINPYRSGGGRSAFEALCNGIPVITRKYGDVYHVCGSDFAVNDYEDVYSQTLKYIRDKEFYTLMADRAHAVADELTNLNRTIEHILNSIMEYENKIT